MPCPFFSKRLGCGGGESLSLGHVIVSKRKLQGSRRLGDHYKTQPGERVAAAAAAALLKTRGAERLQLQPRRLCRPTGRAGSWPVFADAPCSLRLAPGALSTLPSVETAGASAADTTKLFFLGATT